MRRHLLTLALATLFGGVFLASDASACCHKKRGCCPQPQPCVVVQPVVCPVPAPCPAPAPTCCARPRRKLFGHCHKRAACAPVMTTCATPVIYAAPQTVIPSGQASPQG